MRDKPGPRGYHGEFRARIRELIGEGLCNKEIAARLGITERGVKWHVGILRRELGLYGRGDERRFVLMLAREKETIETIR